jgi:hypothetical protein
MCLAKMGGDDASNGLRRNLRRYRSRKGPLRGWKDYH